MTAAIPLARSATAVLAWIKLPQSVIRACSDLRTWPPTEFVSVELANNPQYVDVHQPQESTRTWPRQMAVRKRTDRCIQKVGVLKRHQLSEWPDLLECPSAWREPLVERNSDEKMNLRAVGTERRARCNGPEAMSIFES
jgi:hypothetical protein